MSHGSKRVTLNEGERAIVAAALQFWLEYDCDELDWETLPDTEGKVCDVIEKVGYKVDPIHPRSIRLNNAVPREQ